MYKVVSITNNFGEAINLDDLEFIFVGEDYCLAKRKGYGFVKGYASYDGYTVITEKVEA